MLKAVLGWNTIVSCADVGMRKKEILGVITKTLHWNFISYIEKRKVNTELILIRCSPFFICVIPGENPRAPTIQWWCQMHYSQLVVATASFFRSGLHCRLWKADEALAQALWLLVLHLSLLLVLFLVSKPPDILYVECPMSMAWPTNYQIILTSQHCSTFPGRACILLVKELDWNACTLTSVWRLV